MMQPANCSILRAAAMLLLIAMGLATCGGRETSALSDSGPKVYRDEVRFGLSFEERMAVAAELSRLKADAGRRADEMYDPFRSRENAQMNEAQAESWFSESRNVLLEERGISAAELEEIVKEYQASLGANLR